MFLRGIKGLQRGINETMERIPGRPQREYHPEHPKGSRYESRNNLVGYNSKLGIMKIRKGVDIRVLNENIKGHREYQEDHIDDIIQGIKTAIKKSYGGLVVLYDKKKQYQGIQLFLFSPSPERNTQHKLERGITKTPVQIPPI